MIEENQWDDALIAQVHPPTWKNPTPAPKYDLVVIGAGTAGLVTAAGAAGLGARVALIERHLMGGDCLNVGCVPSKGLISAGRMWANAKRASSEYGGPTVLSNSHGDFRAMMDRMRKIRSEMSVIDSAPRFRDLGVDVFLGDGAFTSARTITVAGAALNFRKAVIATGARAAAPPIPGLESVPYLTNESVFDLTELPARMVVIGAGPIGCELAQCFARFGSQVTMLATSARMLPRDDADAAAVIQEALFEDGVRFAPGVEITSVTKSGSEILVGTRTNGSDVVHACDALLIAVGRAPNVESLGLDRADVAFTRTGVTVDDRLRTSNSDVYAVGDICSALQFTHAADFQARMVIQNALFFGRAKATDLITPWATYTSPELAQVGHTVESAAAAGVAIQSFSVPLHDVDRARLEGETRGFCKVLVRAGTDTIVGATIVAPNAGDMISEVTLAMTNGLGLGAIGKTMHPYPTHGEVLRKVADSWRRTKLTPFVKKLFLRYFSLFQ